MAQSHTIKLFLIMNFRVSQKEALGRRSMDTEYFYAGTYTQPILFGTGEVFQGKGEGIYYLALDKASGCLSVKGLTEGVDNPSYLCISPDKKYIYAVNELKKFRGKDSGSVSAFSVDADTGGLTFLNLRPSGGTDPCHININAAQTHVYVSNFMSGSVSVFPIEKDGSLGEMSCFIQHMGSGAVPGRQEGPHAHSLVFDRTQAHAIVPDLGLDKLMVYKTDFAKGNLAPGETPYLKLPAGSGPRHLVFHPGYRFAYLVNEIASSVSLLYYEEKRGSFEIVQTADTVLRDRKKGNICADIHISPDGRFLFCSNRGDDSLAVFCVCEDDGTLRFAERVPCGGRTPRNFVIDSDGEYLLAGNQDTDNIVVFRINHENGGLTQVSELPLPSPVCIRQVR